MAEVALEIARVQEAADARENTNETSPFLGAHHQKQELHGAFVERVELDRARQPAQGHGQTPRPRTLRVRNRDASADSRAHHALAPVDVGDHPLDVGDHAHGLEHPHERLDGVLFRGVRHVEQNAGFFEDLGKKDHGPGAKK